jgi:ribosomal protein L11 methyltransferase
VPDTWTAVIVTADAELADSLSSFLIDQGAPGVVIDDLPGQVRITANFGATPPLVALQRFCDDLGAWFPQARRPRFRVETLSAADWAESWKEHFPPLPVGETLFVHPPWVRDMPPGRIGIELNPGVAFGTGHHATTRGCLLLLEQVMRERAAGRVLDLGTGSGILAIAAAKLGAGEVWAVDVDPEACAVATENARANGVESVVHVRAAADAAPGTFDVLLANLFAGQLVELAATMCGRLEAEGVVIGAGILEGEVAGVVSAWRCAGLRVAVRHQESEWVTLRARRS